MERALESLMSWWDVSGVDIPEIPKNAPRRLPTQQNTGQKQTRNRQPHQEDQQTRAATPTPHATNKSPSVNTAELVKKIENLEQLRLAITDFDAGEISDHARQTVFSRGNPKADIMVIGEAPGRDEDIQGKPFVGKSGQLLDRIFAAIGLNEDSLYLTNVINWRPPGNRNPTSEEVATCLPLIHKHIELIAPKIIVLVGGVSVSALTEMTGIMKNRGQWTVLKNGETEIPALPIFHPAFLLHQPALKKEAWRDMLSLRMKLAELDLAKPTS